MAFAAATAVIVLAWVGVFRPPQPVIQIAMLDMAGPTRGSGTADEEALRHAWQGATAESFSTASELEAWEKDWSPAGSRPRVKIAYDRSAGELRLMGRYKTDAFQRVFPVEGDLARALKRVKAFLEEQPAR